MNDYSKKLGIIIKKIIKPLKRIPFNLVIENLSGFKIIPFNKRNEKDLIVLKKLKQVALITGKKVNKKGIIRPRPNEAGNDIEKFVENALNEIGYKAGRPKTKNEKIKSSGYPDLEFLDEFNRNHYLECKTFNIENISTTQRSFYLSPSKDFKITKNAHHFVISFEIFVEKRIGRNNVYKCKSWKILSIENLEVDVKCEFNSDNVRLYKDNLILSQGKL